LLKPWIHSNDKFYVIGLWKTDNTVEHEFAHAFFYMDATYKKEISKVVNSMPDDFRDCINIYLKDAGYHPSVFLDETQAYLASNTMAETDEMFRDVPWDEVLELQKIFYKRYEVYRDEEKS